MLSPRSTESQAWIWNVDLELRGFGTVWIWNVVPGVRALWARTDSSVLAARDRHPQDSDVDPDYLVKSWSKHSYWLTASTSCSALAGGAPDRSADQRSTRSRTRERYDSSRSEARQYQGERGLRREGADKFEQAAVPGQRRFRALLARRRKGTILLKVAKGNFRRDSRDRKGFQRPYTETAFRGAGGKNASDEFSCVGWPAIFVRD